MDDDNKTLLTHPARELSKYFRTFAAEINITIIIRIMQTKQKRLYERPQMQVVELREMPQLLAGSADATMDINYYEEDI